MSRVSRTTSSAERPRPRWLLPASALIAVVAVLVAVGLFFDAPRANAPVAWHKFATEDVHSLSFVGADLDHLLFGHHGGLLESRDGGGTWRSLPTTVDAMSMRPAADGSIIIAGHDVFTASVDGGQTWRPIRSDLPSLDIHGFTRAPGDPARMWAYLATGGLWASEDTGGHWTRVRQDNVLFPTAVQNGNETRLFGIDMSGLVASDDGGRTWAAIGSLPAYPITALVATTDGSVLYAGSPDGLARSRDGGRTWGATAFKGAPFAIATSPDGQTVAVVARTTEFFRSPDGGNSWPGPTNN